MNYISVCSGIEAASCAWHPLGWKPIAFSEIEPFPCAVLKHHFPHVPNLGDMTKFHDWPDFKPIRINIVVGGTPCQAFSVAGLREGLADPRGNLTLTFLGVVEKYQPEYVVWENVPGVLSSITTSHPPEMAAPDDLREGEEREYIEDYEADSSHALSCFMDGLQKLGYGVALRCIDAQYCGLAQRRKRVFVVGYLGDWSRAAAILSLADGLFGNPPPSREARQEAAGTLSARTSGGGRLGTDFDLAGGCIADGSGLGVEKKWPAEVTATLNAHFGDKQGLEDQHALGGASLFVPEYTNALTAHNGQRNEISEMARSLIAHSFPVAIHENQRGEITTNDTTGALNKGGGKPGQGYPCVAIPILEAGARTGKSTTDVRAGSGIGTNGDPMFTLQRGKQHAVAIRTAQTSSNGCGIDESGVCYTLDQAQGQAVLAPVTAFGAKGSGADAQEDLSPTLRAAGHDKSHANGGSMPAVAFNWNAQVDQMNFDPNTTPALTRSQEAAIGPVAFQTRIARNGRGQPDEIVPALNGSDAGATSDMRPCVLHKMAVRRLTPEECEALQGFPRGHTNIPVGNKGKRAADGPRYKALGNSMAVPCMSWIGQGIQRDHELHRVFAVEWADELEVDFAD